MLGIGIREMSIDPVYFAKSYESIGGTAIPEPGAGLVILGAALMGRGLAARRRKPARAVTFGV